MPKFLNDLFKRFPKNFCISSKKFHLSPKISDDLFLVIDLFHVLNALFFVGEPKSLLLEKFTMLPLLFLPPRGQTPLPTSMGGHGGFAPSGSATEYSIHAVSGAPLSSGLQEAL